MRGEQEEKPKFALVTLLYDLNFLEGVRVLGRSVQTSRVEKVVLTTASVWSVAKSSLGGEWRLKRVAAAASDASRYRVSNERLRLAYTKLAIFNLTRYAKILYVDADAFILEREWRDLFKCPAEVCAVMRHCELINTGVLVVTPSQKLANDLAKASESTFTYTGGDQGFLNSYFNDFQACPYFDPQNQQQTSHRRQRRQRPQRRPSFIDDSSSSHRCMRLPARFNGDWPLVFANGGSSSIVISHLTLGSIKPWNWQIAPFFPSVHAWQSYSVATYDIGASLKPLPWFLCLVYACSYCARPLRRPITRCAFAYVLLTMSAYIATCAAGNDLFLKANATWTKVAVWFCVTYLVSLAAYVQKTQRFYAHRAFGAFAFLFVALVVAILALPTLLLFDTNAKGDLLSLLVLLLPILYLFLVLNTAAAVLLIPGPVFLRPPNNGDAADHDDDYWRRKKQQHLALQPLPLLNDDSTSV